tara:strand:+ start:1530 stop:2039 length:510 start_codon:yes stop_codon:yes gene_type:complete
VIKKFKLILLVIFFNSISSLSNANNIAYVNLDNILQNSNLGKKTLIRIDQKKNIEQKKINEREDNIKLLELEIKNKQNIISQDEFNKELSKLKKRINDFQLYKKQVYNNFEKLKNDEITIFFDQINPYVQDYLSKNSIDILFNNKNIVIGKDSLDITDKLINIINKSIK